MTDLNTTSTPASSPKPRKARAVKAKAKKSKKAKQVNSIVPARFKQAYAEHDDTNGSKLAVALKEATSTTNKEGRPCLDVDRLFQIAKANGVDTKPYAKMNNGQKRMNIGNKLRGLVLAGETVKIGSARFEGNATIKAKAKAEPLAA